MRRLTLLGASLMLLSTLAGCAQSGTSPSKSAAGPAQSSSATSTGDPVVRAALRLRPGTSGRIVGYGFVYSYWASPKKYYRARFVVMQDRTFYLLSTKSPDFQPIPTPPPRLQPESPAERRARELTLALVENKVPQVYKELKGVTPYLVSYAVRIGYPDGTSATFLVTPDGKSDTPFSVGNRHVGWMPWPTDGGVGY